MRSLHRVPQSFFGFVDRDFLYKSAAPQMFMGLVSQLDFSAISLQLSSEQENVLKKDSKKRTFEHGDTKNV